MERTVGGLYLPDETLGEPTLPAMAAPIEPTGTGLAIESGMATAFFVTDPTTWLAELDRPLVMVANRGLDLEDLIDVLETAAKTARPIAIVAAGLSTRARALMVVNKLRGTITCSAIETTRCDEIAAFLGGTLVSAKRVVSGVRTTMFTKLD